MCLIKFNIPPPPPHTHTYGQFSTMSAIVPTSIQNLLLITFLNISHVHSHMDPKMQDEHSFSCTSSNQNLLNKKLKGQKAPIFRGNHHYPLLSKKACTEYFTDLLTNFN